MLSMRQLSKKTRLQADSDPIVARQLARATLDLADDGVKFDGRMLRPGPLLNALVVWWLNRPEAERQEIARGAIVQLERALAEDVQSIPTQEPPPIQIVRVRELPPETERNNEHPRTKKRPRKT